MLVEGIRLEAGIPAWSDINMFKSPITNNLNGDRLNSAAAEDNLVLIPSTKEEINARKKPEKLPSKQQRRAKRPQGESREMKASSCGKSLREVGISFESGVRRSKRIKTRPLEYWKGESFLYGRVNESLQLIGLKYISPAKGDAKLKVKSSISNFPNEILYVAACHRLKISFERYLGKGSMLSGS